MHSSVVDIVILVQGHEQDKERKCPVLKLREHEAGRHDIHPVTFPFEQDRSLFCMRNKTSQDIQY